MSITRSPQVFTPTGATGISSSDAQHLADSAGLPLTAFLVTTAARGQPEGLLG
ncbi:hypothetical protein [Kutzneria sp. 744]|uniref:hypothetical protein n=1 Tax=Kutzneria sp. (strain 744) TaxID=345341 RepID=UPI0004BAA2F7|nr:hypothetical protein [Kutzneria sp. 744]